MKPSRTTAEVQIVVRDDGLAPAHELSSYPLSHNFGDTLRRYHEHYHDKIGAGPTEHDGEGIASAHDIVRFKHPVSPEDIVPDTLPRALWLDEIDGVALTDYVQDHPATLRFTRPGIVKTLHRGRGDRDRHLAVQRPGRTPLRPPASTWPCPVAMASSAATCWPTAAFPAASASRSTCRKPAG
jgi:hypothetical protein